MLVLHVRNKMELFFIFIIISVVTSASSKAVTSPGTKKDIISDLPLVRDACEHASSARSNNSVVTLPTYSIYLLGFTILLMFIAIVGLSVTLYFVLKRKTIFGINSNNKQYVRQVSTGVTPLHNASYDDKNQKNGSTLTVCSGIIEISEPRQSEPTTPIQIETPSTKIIFAKKPLKPIVPVMDRGQMDALCKEVLKKVSKSDSACYRDLNDLLKFENKADDTKNENTNKNEEKSIYETQLLKLKKLNTEIENEIKTEEVANKTDNKNKTEKETNIKTKLETESQTNENVLIEVSNVESDKNTDNSDSETVYDTVPSPIKFRHSGPETEQTMYDTVPTPTRLRHSGPEPELCMYDTVPSPKILRNSGEETDDDLDDIPLYDTPPMRSQDDSSRNLIQLMAPESQYLVLISSENTDSCYINAKMPKS